MREREPEEDQNERLKQLYSDLRQEWDSMKTGRSSADSSITVEKALQLLEASPRRLMLHLQNDNTISEKETLERQIKGRKLFVDSDDESSSVQESKVESVLFAASVNHKTPFDDADSNKAESLSSFWSPNRDDLKNVTTLREQKRIRIVRRIAAVCFAVSIWLLIALMKNYNRSGKGLRRITLVPT